jgi:HEAT repeat protein
MVKLVRDVRARRWAGLAVVLALALTLGCAPQEDPAVAKAKAVLQQTIGVNPDYERYALIIFTGSAAPEARELIVEKMSSDNFQTAMEAVNALGDDPFAESMEPLRQVFGSKGGALKRQAAVQLARLGDADALEYLRQQIADPVQTLNIPAVVVLARTEGGEEFLRPLMVQRMASEDPAVHDEVYATLGEIGEPWATKLLVEGLKQERGEGRQQAILALGRTADPEVAGEIDRFVNTKGLVFATLEALGELKNPESVRAVQSMADNEEAVVRAYAGVALWKLGEKDAALQIVDSLIGDADPTVRRILVEQLGSVDDEAAWGRLAALAEDEDKAVRVEAMRAIGANPRPEFEEVLITGAGDSEYEVATLGLNILGRVGRGGAVEKIEPLMDSENPYVAMSAAGAVLAIRGREPASADS